MKGSVPFLREEVIEGEAELLLAEFGREHGDVVCPPVPIDEIIELHLKLEFELRDLQTLFGFGDVHGAIWFRERLIAVDEQLDPARHPASGAATTSLWRMRPGTGGCTASTTPCPRVRRTCSTVSRSSATSADRPRRSCRWSGRPTASRPAC